MLSHRLLLLLISGQIWPSRSLDRSYRAEFLRCVDGGEGSVGRAGGETWAVQLARARNYLNGRKMVVATINRPPFIILQMAGEEIVAARGYCIEMLDEIARRFNFTYRLVPPYDGNWGAPMKNGTFNGMVGMVQTKRVDFAIASITITYIRERVIDFTHAIYYDPTTILIPPPSEQNNFLAFLEPFSWQVWVLILASVPIVSVVMWIVGNVGDMPVLYPHARHSGGTHPFLRYLWDCTFTLATQPQRMRMRHTEPVRVLNGTWWMFSIILVYTYTGTLISFLTVPRMTDLINSLEELANQKELLWTYIDNSAHETLFANAPPPSTYSKIGQLHKDRPGLLVDTDDEGLAAVLRGSTAFIKEKSFLDFAMERDYLATKKCRMAQVKQHFFSAGFGWVLQDGAPYLQLFNNQILRMSQSGLLTAWRQQYWPRPNECTASTTAQTSAPKALKLKNFSGHFFIFGVGLSLALVTLLLERTIHACTTMI